MSDNRSRARRLDAFLLLAALVTAGTAAILFWASWRIEQNNADESARQPSETPSATVTESPTATPTVSLTPTASITPSRVPSNTPTPTYTHTPTNTATYTDTPTATFTASNTPSHTPTNTSTHTFTPSATSTTYPLPQVNPIALAETYAGEPIIITGSGLAGNIIVLLDNDTEIAETSVDEDGNWRIELSEGLPAGEHRLELFASDGRDQSAMVPLGFVFNDAPTHTPSNTPTATQTATAPPTITAGATRTEVSQQIRIVTATPDEGVTNAPSPSTTPSPTSTVDVALAPVSATPTESPSPMPPSPMVTASPTASTTPTDASPTPDDTPEDTLAPLAAARIDTPQNPYSPFAAVEISGTGDPNTTLTFTANGEIIGTTRVDSEGNWVFLWAQNIFSTALDVVAASDDGRESPAARANITVEALPPRIDSPRSGFTMTPGNLTLSGTAQSNAPITVIDQNGNEFGNTTATVNGNWEIDLAFTDFDVLTLQAIIIDEDGAVLAESNAVRVTIAESIAPETGGILTNSDEQTQRLYITLIALLMSSFGFIMIYIGRLINYRSKLS